MHDIDDAMLREQAPLILGSLVRLSIRSLRSPGETDSARRLAALAWFTDWASRSIDGYPGAAIGPTGSADSPQAPGPESWGLRGIA